MQKNVILNSYPMEKNFIEEHFHWIGIIADRIICSNKSENELPLLSLSFLEGNNIFSFFSDFERPNFPITIDELSDAKLYGIIVYSLSSKKKYDKNDIKFDFDSIVSILFNEGYIPQKPCEISGLKEGNIEHHINLCKSIEFLVADRSLNIELISSDLRRLPKSFFVLKSDMKIDFIEDAVSLWLSKFHCNSRFSDEANESALNIENAKNNEFHLNEKNYLLQIDTSKYAKIAACLSRVFPKQINKNEIKNGDSEEEIMHNIKMSRVVLDEIHAFVIEKFPIDEHLFMLFVSDLFYATRSGVKKFVKLEHNQPVITQIHSLPLVQLQNKDLKRPQTTQSHTDKRFLLSNQEHKKAENVNANIEKPSVIIKPKSPPKIVKPKVEQNLSKISTMQNKTTEKIAKKTNKIKENPKVILTKQRQKEPIKSLNPKKLQAESKSQINESKSNELDQQNSLTPTKLPMLNESQDDDGTADLNQSQDINLPQLAELQEDDEPQPNLSPKKILPQLAESPENELNNSQRDAPVLLNEIKENQPSVEPSKEELEEQNELQNKDEELEVQNELQNKDEESDEQNELQNQDVELEAQNELQNKNEELETQNELQNKDEEKDDTIQETHSKARKFAFEFPEIEIMLKKLIEKLPQKEDFYRNTYDIFMQTIQDASIVNSPNVPLIFRVAKSVFEQLLEGNELDSDYEQKLRSLIKKPVIQSNSSKDNTSKNDDANDDQSNLDEIDADESFIEEQDNPEISIDDSKRCKNNQRRVHFGPLPNESQNGSLIPELAENDAYDDEGNNYQERYSTEEVDKISHNIYNGEENIVSNDLHDDNYNDDNRDNGEENYLDGIQNEEDEMTDEMILREAEKISSQKFHSKIKKLTSSTRAVPSAKRSNTVPNYQTIINALRFNSLPSPKYKKLLDSIIDILKDFKDERILLLMASRTQKFKGIYVLSTNGSTASKIWGEGPNDIINDDVKIFYKYLNGQKSFDTIATKSFTQTTDGFSLQKNLESKTW